MIGRGFSRKSALLKQPTICTQGERREFARLVREGFPAAANLDGRIRDARWLAFYYAPDDTLAAVAALKAPAARYREDVFRKADARVSSAEYQLELGWVFVAPAHRGEDIGLGLCEQLLRCAPGASVFATTRTDNVHMWRILRALGFTRVGRPYPRRDEELVLFLRS